MKLTCVSFLLILAIACGTNLKPPEGKTFAAPGQSSQAVAVSCTTWQDCDRSDYAECGAVVGTSTLICMYQPCSSSATCPSDRPLCDTTVGPVGSVATGYCRKNTFDNTLPPGDARCLNNAACGVGVSCYVTAADTLGVCRTDGDTLPCIANRSSYVSLCGHDGVSFMGDPSCTDRKWRPMVDGGACAPF